MKDIKKYKKEYNKKYYEEYKEKILEDLKKWREINKGYMKEYCQEHKEYMKEHSKKYNEKFRIDVLNFLSKDNPHCVKCGCDDIRLLEINHKNGGGSKELQGGKLAIKFSKDILTGKRETDDLELLCRICNAKHYLELKYGELPYKISYKK